MTVVVVEKYKGFYILKALRELIEQKSDFTNFDCESVTTIGNMNEMARIQ